MADSKWQSLTDDAMIPACRLPVKRTNLNREKLTVDFHTKIVYTTAMMKNITLSADETLIERARQRAVVEHTTLNELFRAWLAR